MDFKDKIKTLGFSRLKGTRERRPVINENTGKVGGYHTVHWDDRQDATITPEVVKLETKVGDEG